MRASSSSRGQDVPGDSERLARYRWTVELTLARLLGYCRLGVPYERRANLLLRLLHLACALICMCFLTAAAD